MAVLLTLYSAEQLNCVELLFFVRERFPKKSWETPIPEESKLKDDDLTAFVECLKPAVMLAVFNKSGSFDAAGALQNLALIKPDIVLPTLLDK